MKHGAITFGILLAAGLAGGVAFVGCSSDDGNNNTNTTPDTGVVDTGTAVDSTPADTAKPETGLVACEQKLSSSFACTEPADKAGKTVCTDVMINEFMNCFGSTGDSKKCTAAQTKYPACNTCILKDWLTNNRIDVGACIKKIDPASTCGKTIQCTTDCLDVVCPSDECDDTAGSGSTATKSQLDDCYTNAQRKPGSATKPTGQCWDVAVKDYATCSGDAKFAPCFVRSTADLLTYFRGACRDNGNWTNADKPDGSEDAGVADTGTDSGSTDSGSTDSGSAADSASTDAASSDAATDATGD